jgi:hypothetical protein
MFRRCLLGGSPWWERPVGGTLLFNLLLPAYELPAALAGLSPAHASSGLCRNETASGHARDLFLHPPVRPESPFSPQREQQQASCEGHEDE